MSKLIGWDTETYQIQPGLLAPPIVIGSLAVEGAPAGRLLTPEECLDLVGTESAGLNTIVGANVAYDFACLLATFPESEGLFDQIWQLYSKRRVLDVQIASTLNAIAEGRLQDGELLDKRGQRMIDPSKGKITNRYSLAVCVKEWLGRDDAKRNDVYRLRYGELDGVPVEYWPFEARQYPIDDAINTLEVGRAVVAGAQNLHNQPEQAHAAFCMHLSAVWGLRTDPERVSKFKLEIEDRLARLRKEAKERGFLKEKKVKGEIKLSKDTKAIQAAVEAAFGLAEPPRTETGKISTSRDTLEDADDPKLQVLQDLSKAEKLITYVPDLEHAAAAPLNVKPNPLLSTGRASYEGLIQLMPRKGGVRPCFKFRGVGCSVDYSAIELSTLAQCCLWMLNYSRLAEAINAEKDPHSILGAQLVNDSYEAFLARLKAGDGATKDLRQAGKAGNFGFPGMMGAPKFVIAKAKEGLRVCELFFRDGRCKQEGLITEWRGRPIGRALCERCVTLAAKLKKTYTDTWTEIPQYWDLVTSEVQRFGTVTQFVSKRVRGGVTEPAAANSLFQGLAADGAKAALVAITNECYSKRRSPLYGSRVVIFAHDEIITDIPDRGPQAVAEAANLQAEIMVREMRRFVPDVRVSAEPALMRYWYKDAVPVFDNGVLVPWAPKEAV